MNFLGLLLFEGGIVLLAVLLAILDPLGLKKHDPFLFWD